MTASPANAMPILMVGLNHKVAPVEIRERLAFAPERVKITLRELTEHNKAIAEAILLSTCNRTEVYVYCCHLAEAESQLYDFLSLQAGLPSGELRRMLYIARDQEAALHLMQVAAGLDSLVLGENEILGQVRSASEIAQAVGTGGPFLSALFRYAIQAGKRARTETLIGQGNISVASVVVELAEQVLGPLNDRTALLIGAGKISSITARALVRAGLHCVMIANRTFEHAQKLAKTLNGLAVHFDALEETLTQADIVICSTGAPHIVLHAETMAKAQQARQGRPLLVADLAVPRDADPDIASIPGVHLTNIDDLAIVVKNSHPLTASICQAVEEIVQEELESFWQWCYARRCAPIIQALHLKAEDIYQTEVSHTLRRLGPLSPHQELLIQAMGKAIVSKLLHGPTICLRELPPDADVSTYLRIVQDLYHIP